MPARSNRGGVDWFRQLHEAAQAAGTHRLVTSNM
jgi:hypothetical protein